MAEKEKHKVLLLEDNLEDAELLQRKLAKIGLSLETKHAANKAEYTAALESFNPEIVISDYKLPDMDGLLALRLARERFPNIPFIIVSGLIDDKFAAETLEAGVTDFLLKDRPERLASAVTRAIRDVEQRRIKNEYDWRSEQLESEKADLQRRESRIRQIRQELLALKSQLRKLE